MGSRSSGWLCQIQELPLASADTKNVPYMPCLGDIVVVAVIEIQYNQLPRVYCSPSFFCIHFLLLMTHSARNLFGTEVLSIMCIRTLGQRGRDAAAESLGTNIIQ